MSTATGSGMWLRTGMVSDEIHQRTAQRLAQPRPVALAEPLRADDLPRSGSWWQVTSERGVVTEVVTNKPTGSAMGRWTVRNTVSESGDAVYQIELHRPGVSPIPVSSWTLPAEICEDDLEYELGDLVGTRIARGIIRRLRNGPTPSDRVRVRG